MGAAPAVMVFGELIIPLEYAPFLVRRMRKSYIGAFRKIIIGADNKIINGQQNKRFGVVKIYCHDSG
jgi:hypothetical protein